MKTAAAYIRVSTDRQTELSPESQLKEIRQFAERNDILLLENHIYRDDGISGTSVKNREDFLRMISAATRKPAEFDCVIVWKFSRFARSRQDSIVYKGMLKRNGVQVISVSEPLPDDDISSITESLIESMDEYYSKRLSTEVRRGMSEKLSRGLPVAAPPVGYSMENGQYVIDDSSNMIRGIFEDFSAGMSRAAITHKYNDMGLRTKRGGIIDRRFIDYVLHNPIYIGKIRWCTNGRGASRRDYDNENNVIVDGIHEPIIDTELWDKCQKRLTEVKQRYGKHSREQMASSNAWMLRGLVRCSNCGNVLIKAHCGNGEVRVQCNGYNHSTCKVSHSIALHLLNEIVVEGLQKSCALCSFRIEPVKHQREHQADDIDKMIKNETVKEKRLTDAYLAGVIDMDEFAEKKKAISQSIQALRRRRNEQSQNNVEIDIDAYSQKVLSVIDFIKHSNNEIAKAEALRSILNKIVYNRKKNEVELYFYI